MSRSDLMNTRWAAGLACVVAAASLGACQRSSSGPSELSASGGTYYMAIGEPGADNARCDGKSPVDRGNGQCPFRDFSAVRTLHLLDNSASVRLELRGGTYAIPEGLTINGAGSSEGERVVLTAHAGEPVVLDGGGASRELLQVSGRFVTVQGLTLQNSRGYNLEVRAGRQIMITGNRFRANVASDSLKGDGGASDVVVRGNEFTQWDSQAIDLTAVNGWTIEGNRFYAPRSADANAIGIKLASRDITVVGNQFEDTRGLSLGGTSSPHGSSYEAFSIMASRNVLKNVPGFAFTIYSCSGCTLQGNDVDGAGAGVRLVGSASTGLGGCAGGCRPSQNVSVSGNRFRDMRGSLEGTPDVFWAVEAGETAGLSASGNTYCQSRPAAGRFWHAGTFLDFSAWGQLVPGDTGSRLALRSEAACLAW